MRIRKTFYDVGIAKSFLLAGWKLTTIRATATFWKERKHINLSKTRNVLPLPTILNYKMENWSTAHSESWNFDTTSLMSFLLISSVSTAATRGLASLSWLIIRRSIVLGLKLKKNTDKWKLRKKKSCGMFHYSLESFRGFRLKKFKLQQRETLRFHKCLSCLGYKNSSNMQLTLNNFPIL